MLQPEIKQKWIAALRSGEYNQGQQYLKRVDANKCTKYCCLGVLGEILEIPFNAGKSADRFKGDNSFTSSEPYPLLKKKANLKFEHQTILYKMNDEHNNSFLEIADYIEKTVDI